MTDTTLSRAQRAAEQTDIRRRLLANGYSPFPCAGKNRQMFGWEGIQATEALIDDWADQLKWVSTAIHVGPGRLIGLDVDIDDAEVLADFKRRIPAPLWKKLEASPVRYGGGVKEMLFARLAEGERDAPKHAKTGQWGPTGGPDHKLEIFLKPNRLLAVYGARMVDDDRQVTSAYRWRDGIGLHNTPLGSLPEITLAEVDTLLAAAIEAFQAVGWDRLDLTPPAEPGSVVFDLKAGQLFKTVGGDLLTMAELVDACHGGTVDLWSWLPGHHNRGDRCHGFLHERDGGLCVRDHHTDLTHRPEDLDPSKRLRDTLERLGAELTKRVAQWRERAQNGDTRARAVLKVAEEAKEAVATGPVMDESGRVGLNFMPGSLRELAEDTVSVLLVLHPMLFNRGGAPVVVDPDGGVREVRGEALAHEIQRSVFLMEVRGKQEHLVPFDPPKALTARVEALVGRLRPLRSVVDVPVIRRDGSLLAQGYDGETRLLVRADPDMVQGIPETVDSEAAARALKTLWKPFRLFPFAGPLDKGGALAALLTAVIRPVLPTAPAFGFDAPGQSNGKTLLARSVAALAGYHGEVQPPLPTKDDDEVRKVLLSVLRGADRAIVFDNMVGIFDSPALAACLTAEGFSGRLLGSNTTLRVPTNTLFLLSGNNLAFANDMPRRVVRSRIDAETERPNARVFDFCPLAMTKTRRMNMVAAALTLIKAALPHAEAGRVGSFEMWDEMVGQTVAWVRDNLDGSFGDPAEGIFNAVEEDPRRDEIHDLLTTLRQHFGNEVFQAKDVKDRCKTSDAIASALNMDTQKAAPRAIGQYLANRKDVIVAGLRLRATKNPKTKTQQFRVVSDDDQKGAVVRGVFANQYERCQSRKE